MSRSSSSAEFLMLKKIYYMLRTVASGVINGGGGTGGGNYDYLTSFIVGTTPGAPTDGTTTYVNPSVTGDIKVYKNGTGYLTEGVNYELIEGGGIELLGGSQFYNDESYTIFKVNS